MADTVKCPNCGANLVFDADSQKLTCGFCGGEFTAEELDKIRVEELEDAPEETVSEEAPEPEEDRTSEEAREFVCNACGAVVVTDANTSASFCAFCGSPALVGQRLTREFKPKYVIPFKYGRDKAIEKFFSWCKGGRLTPLDFVSEKNISKITGLYVPFWLYNAKGHMDITATASTSSSKTTGNKTVTTVTTYEIRRDRRLEWDKIPLDGETKIDDLLMEAIEPFDFKKMIPYDYKYLAGFYADVYDLNKEDLKPRCAKRVSEYIMEEYKKSVTKYPGAKIISDKSGVDGIDAEYALLPVWFLQYKHQGKNYCFAMNGQTGEVAGTPPVSILKLTVLFIVLVSILVVIVNIINGIIIGGFLG